MKNNMKEKILKIIKEFHRKYDMDLTIGFICGIAKTTKQTVHTSIRQLEKEGKIEVIQEAKRFGIRVRPK